LGMIDDGTGRWRERRRERQRVSGEGVDGSVMGVYAERNARGMGDEHRMVEADILADAGCRDTKSHNSIRGYFRL